MWTSTLRRTLKTGVGRRSPESAQRLQQKFQRKKHGSKQQLESLAGSLKWVSYVVMKVFFFLLRLIFSVLNSLQQWKHKTRLTKALRNLQWRLSFLHVFNGTVYFNEHAKQHTFVDACNTAAPLSGPLGLYPI